MIGNQIANFRIVEKLGAGGMGVVYKGVDIQLDRPVAIKVLSTEFVGNPELMQRFQAEAKAQANLNHTNLATLYAFLIVEGNAFMVMEFVDGENFDQIIHRSGPMQAKDAVPWFKQALLGIGAAHRVGIVHRDIKPSNLMLNRQGIVKVMDFGIAKALGTRGMTKTGMQLGTLNYMSPEQIQNRGVDVRSDIYALGITLYEMLSGHTPFEGDSDFQIMHDHVTATPPPLHRYYPYAPREYEPVLAKALAKNPDDRFQTVEEMGAGLEHPENVIVPPPMAAPPIVRGTVMDPTGSRVSSSAVTMPLTPTAPPGPAPAAGAGMTVLAGTGYAMPAAGARQPAPVAGTGQAVPAGGAGQTVPASPSAMTVPMGVTSIPQGPATIPPAPPAAAGTSRRTILMLAISLVGLLAVAVMAVVLWPNKTAKGGGGSVPPPPRQEQQAGGASATSSPEEIVMATGGEKSSGPAVGADDSASATPAPTPHKLVPPPGPSSGQQTAQRTPPPTPPPTPRVQAQAQPSQDQLQRYQQEQLRQKENAQGKNFLVKHRHIVGAQTYYCAGWMNVKPDGTVSYVCAASNDPSGRCERVTFPAGTFQQVKLVGGGMLHLSTSGMGNWDFFDYNVAGSAVGAYQSIQGSSK
jgi:serine/threonine-protein kinase